MKIKWKFEEDREDHDEYGNLKPYYKDTEPWKKVSKKPNIFLQVFLIILAIAACLGVIAIAFNIAGFNWSGTVIIHFIRDLAQQRM